MEFINFLALAFAFCWVIRSKLQQQRIDLLAEFSSVSTIEKNTKALTQGYLGALAQADPGRREQAWIALRRSEQELCRQLTQLAADFSAADPPITRVSKLPIWIPFGTTLAGSFDMREALHVHARGVCRAIEGSTATPRERAFAILAELLLMQHTCQWFCRSKWVASGHMLARHRTSYPKLLASVLPQTRSEYLGLVSLGGAPG